MGGNTTPSFSLLPQLCMPFVSCPTYPPPSYPVCCLLACSNRSGLAFGSILYITPSGCTIRPLALLNCGGTETNSSTGTTPALRTTTTRRRTSNLESTHQVGAITHGPRLPMHRATRWCTAASSKAMQAAATTKSTPPAKSGSTAALKAAAVAPRWTLRWRLLMMLA